MVVQWGIIGVVFDFHFHIIHFLKTAGNPVEMLLDDLSDFKIHVTGISAQNQTVLDDIAAADRLEGADCHNRHIIRVDAPGNDGLQVHHKTGGRHDRIVGSVRLRSMPTRPLDRDFDVTAAGIGVAARIKDGTHFIVRIEMDAIDFIDII